MKAQVTRRSENAKITFAFAQWRAAISEERLDLSRCIPWLSDEGDERHLALQNLQELSWGFRTAAGFLSYIRQLPFREIEERHLATDTGKHLLGGLAAAAEREKRETGFSPDKEEVLNRSFGE